jgi:hypothetical protein
MREEEIERKRDRETERQRERVPGKRKDGRCPDTTYIHTDIQTRVKVKNETEFS